MTFAARISMLLLTLPVSACNGPRADAETASPPIPGEVLSIVDRTLMIVGTPLNFTEGRADAGNIVLHADGEHLYIIDSGAMDHYRPIILDAAESLRPFSHVVLINTHNHIDHNGNNDVIFAIPADSHRHLMSANAIESLRDQAGYFAKSAMKAAPYAPVLGEYLDRSVGDPAYWEKALQMFDPMRTSIETAVPLEHMPMEVIQRGGHQEVGWQIDGVLDVLPTRGHTAGSVVLYIPEVKLLVLGDEGNRAFHAWHDANNLNALLGFRRYVAMVDAGLVDVFVDGHGPGILRGEDRIRAHLQRYIDLELEEQGRTIDLFAGQTAAEGRSIDYLIDRFLADDWLGPRYSRLIGIAPFAIPFMVLQRLDEMGFDTAGEPPETRFRFPVPEQPQEGHRRPVKEP
ncbi:MAG: MBL fold metallo-hydrolase [Pseudomonadota bacterium]